MSNGLFFLLMLIALALIAAPRVAEYGKIPTTTFMVICGVLTAFVPGLPEVKLDPHLVIELFLPALLYHHAAFKSDYREIRADIGPILVLGAGLTIVTTAVVAVVAGLFLPGFGVPLALALGAALAPTEASPAALILRGRAVPKRTMAILEGESLVNEGVALLLFVLAVQWMSGTHGKHLGLDLWAALGEIGGGIAIGLAVAAVVVLLRRASSDPGTQIVLSLLTPFLAHHISAQLGASGPFATVAAGLYVASRTGRDLHTPARATERFTWRVMVFLMGGTLAFLLGLQFRDLPEPRSGFAVAAVCAAAAGVVVGILLTRTVWCLLVGPLARWIPRGSPEAGTLPWRARMMVALASTRGRLTLVLALALPTSVSGVWLHQRHAVIAISIIAVIALGLKVPLVAVLARRWFPKSGDGHALEEAQAWLTTINAALGRLEEDACRNRFDSGTIALQRYVLKLRRAHVAGYLRAPARRCSPERGRELHSELVSAQREALVALYQRHEISAETLHTMINQLDLQDPRAGRTPDL